MARGPRTLALLVGAAAACSGDAPPVPSELADGSRARPPPVTLEGVKGPVVTTRARVLRRDAAGSTTARCVGSGAEPAPIVVERIGVSGASVTFLGSRRRGAHACDATSRSTRDEWSWCGHAFGRLHGGRLRDPRLSLSCAGADGAPLGFAWIQPARAASYVVVARPGYREVYPVAGDIPLRVMTEHVDLAQASATFAVTEHARDGRRLRAYELQTRVSG